MSRAQRWLWLLALSGLLMQAGCSDNRAPKSADPPEVRAAKEQASAAIAKRRQQNEECIQKRDALTAEFERIRAQGDPWAAIEVVKPCATMTQDPQLLQLVAAGEAAGYLRDAKDEKRLLFDRIKSLETLSSAHPAAFKGNEGLLSSLQARQVKATEAERRAQAAQKKKEGVQLGMTQDDVVQSSWGKPRKVNRTTTALGTREQWVYDGGYLYFDNGVLTSIQN